MNWRVWLNAEEPVLQRDGVEVRQEKMIDCRTLVWSWRMGRSGEEGWDVTRRERRVNILRILLPVSLVSHLDSTTRPHPTPTESYASSGQ